MILTRLCGVCVEIETNLSTATPMVVYTEMVRKIWVIGRRTGIRWGYVNRAYWVDTTGRQNIMLVSRMQEESETSSRESM